jgi:hypothetical protein
LVSCLLEFKRAVMPHKDIVQAQTDALAAEQNLGALIWLEPDLGADRIYCEEMILNPINIVVSWNFRNFEKLLAGLAQSSSAALGVIAVVPRLLIDPHGKDVELPINSLGIRAAFLPLSDLTKRVVGHYVSEGKDVAWRVLAGVFLPGNPVGFVSGIGMGAIDLGRAFLAVQSPEAFVKGLGKGTTSLFKGLAQQTRTRRPLGSLQHEQLRRQRYIAHDGAVPAFDYNQALGQQRFRVAVQDAGPTEQETLREDVLEDYLECGEQKELLVTDRHLLYCSARSLQITPFAAIERIDVPGRGTQVVVHRSTPLLYQRPLIIECGEGEAQAVGEQLRNMLMLERLEDEGGTKAGAGRIAEARASAARRAQAAAAASKNIASV